MKIKSKSKYDIVIIKRIGSREVIDFNEAYLIIKEIYREKNIIIFYPNTPHGAGMTNMIISNHRKFDKQFKYHKGYIKK